MGNNAITARDLRVFEDPIQHALLAYSDVTGGELEFAAEDAAYLDITELKPNTARSITDVRYRNQQIGELVVIAFAPEDCTGDDNTYSLDSLNMRSYNPIAGMVPRSKAAMHTEVHFTIASLSPMAPDGQPITFAGSLDLLSAVQIGKNRKPSVAKIATLGQSSKAYAASMNGFNPEPDQRHVTVTTGYTQEFLPDRPSRLANPTRRFGDPHAVYNATADIQIAAFLGLKPQFITAGFPALVALDATLPAPAKHSSRHA